MVQDNEGIMQGTIAEGCTEASSEPQAKILVILCGNVILSKTKNLVLCDNGEILRGFVPQNDGMKYEPLE